MGVFATANAGLPDTGAEGVVGAAGADGSVGPAGAAASRGSASASSGRPPGTCGEGTGRGLARPAPADGWLPAERPPTALCDTSCGRMSRPGISLLIVAGTDVWVTFAANSDGTIISSVARGATSTIKNPFKGSRPRGS